MSKPHKLHTENNSPDIPLGCEFDFVISFNTEVTVVPSFTEEIKAQFEVEQSLPKKRKVRRSLKKIEARLKRCEQITNREAVPKKVYLGPPRKTQNEIVKVKNYVFGFHNQMPEQISPFVLTHRPLSEYKKRNKKERLKLPPELRLSHSKQIFSTKTPDLRYYNYNYFEQDHDMFDPTIYINKNNNKKRRNAPSVSSELRSSFGP